MMYWTGRKAEKFPILRDCAAGFSGVTMPLSGSQALSRQSVNTREGHSAVTVRYYFTRSCASASSLSSRCIYRWVVAMLACPSNLRAYSMPFSRQIFVPHSWRARYSTRSRGRPARSRSREYDAISDYGFWISDLTVQMVKRRSEVQNPKSEIPDPKSFGGPAGRHGASPASRIPASRGTCVPVLCHI